MASTIKALYHKFIQLFRPTNRNEFIESIITGGFVLGLEDAMFDELVDVGIYKDGVEERMLEAENHLERVIIINNDFPDKQFVELLKDLQSMFRKDENVVKLLEEKGDDFVKKCDHKMSLRCYNLAVLFAPSDTECLGRIYAWRALLFSWLMEGELFHTEMDLALRNNCPEDLELLLLTIKEQQIASKNKFLALEAKSAVEMREYRDNVIFKLQEQPNPRISTAAECVQIKNNKGKGRYLTTDRNVKPATTLIVEEPFAVVLNNVTKWDTAHCSKCLTKLRTTIPCTKCVFVCYCSERCRIEDFEQGHQYECPCFPYLHAIRLSPVLHLALQSICKEGPRKLYKRWKNSENVEKISGINDAEKEQKGVDKDMGKYDSCYHQILNLKSHLDTDSLTAVVWISLSIIKALDYMSIFFSQNEDFEDTNFKMYVASLFLTHGVSFPYNTFELSEESDIKETNISGLSRFNQVEVACAIYPLTSLLCHSCEPTVFRHNLANGKMAIVTYKELQAGDELQISYGCRFITDNLNHREKEIQAGYLFNCKCIACVLNWPTYMEIASSEERYLCPNCSEHYRDSQIIQLKQCVLAHSNDVGYCRNCKTKTELGKLKKEVNKMEKNLYAAHEMIKCGKPIEAIPLLTNCIAFSQAYLAAPVRIMILAQMYLFDAYAMIKS